MGRKSSKNGVKDEEMDEDDNDEEKRDDGEDAEEVVPESDDANGEMDGEVRSNVMLWNYTWNTYPSWIEFGEPSFFLLENEASSRQLIPYYESGHPWNDDQHLLN